MVKPDLFKHPVAHLFKPRGCYDEQPFKYKRKPKFARTEQKQPEINLMLTDSDKRRTNPNPRSMTAPTNKRWSDSQKMEAVNSYVLLGNLSMTGRILGIPLDTLNLWRKSEWWQTLLLEVRSQERIQLTGRLRKMVDASLSVVEDRLAHGDFQFDQKSGQVVRKPVNMKDAHKVAMDLQERQEVLEKAEKPETTEDGIELKLLSLANKFAEMATKKIEQQNNSRRTVEAEDIEDAKIKESVIEERT
jgi:transposase-like protein